ncbi:MAG TPA: ExbD/TolR family protein [Burkholderiaceae bacterium]|jgi:biopolymer transport protein TolR|nr:ExbD/TolR family protein [Burkholderiaceae bacterium]
MAVLAQRTAGSRRRLLSDINVVPWIDVMLVLVVILMVSAPFVNPSLVDLPSVGKSTRAPDAPLEVIVKADGSLLLRDRTPGAASGGQAVPIELDQLLATVRNRQRSRPDTPVVIAGDKKARYESVTRVLDALYKGNVRRVGLVVKPAE